MAGMFRRNGKGKGKKKGVYQAKYYVNGKPKYVSLRTRREDVAKKRLAKLEHTLEETGNPDRSHTPLKAFRETYETHIRNTHGGSAAGSGGNRPPRKTAGNELSRLRQFFDEWLEKRHSEVRTLEAVTPAVISQFLAKKQRDGRKSRTMNHYRAAFHTMFAFAIKRCGFISPDKRFPNPVAAIDRAPEQSPEIRYLERGDIDDQLKAIQELIRSREDELGKLPPKDVASPKAGRIRADIRKSKQTLAVVAVYIYAGLRREEALWLTPKDVDLRKRMLIVRAKTVDGEYWQPKTRRNRAVPISTSLLARLRDYSPSEGSTWYFPSPEGKRWHPDNWSHYLAEINKEAGLLWTCLDFRHTFGSHLAQKGVSLYQIATLMGNSPDICRKHYAQLVPERMRDTVEFGFEGDEQGPAAGRDGKVIRLDDYRTPPASGTR